MNAKGLLIASAVAMLFLSGAVSARAEEKAGGDQVVCDRINACKGQGSCAGAGHSCAGKNACKGQGHTKTTAADCKATYSPARNSSTPSADTPGATVRSFAEALATR